ncbi:hypothetical protein PG990_009018 [Apiospora arundinis]
MNDNNVKQAELKSGAFTLKIGSGLKCSSGTFYICNNSGVNSITFAGCCNSDPCTNGCSPTESRAAIYDGELNRLTQFTCFNQEKVSMQSWWRDCNGSNGSPKYVGCCETSVNLCETSVCPSNNTGFARFHNDATQKDFIDKFGSFSSTSINSVPSASPTITVSSSPPGSIPTTGNSTNTTIPGQNNPPDSANIGTGGVAGVAIGCTIAGLLLGALVAFLLSRRREHRTARPEHVQVSYAPGKGQDTPHPMAVGNDVSLDQFMLHPKPDNEIVSDLRALDALIRQHVENNYHLKPVHQTPKFLAQALITLGFSDYSQQTPDDVARLAIDARTRLATLQLVITRVAFQSSMLSMGSGAALVSMLPPSVAAFAHSVPATERHRGNAEAAATGRRSPPEETVAQQAQQLAKELNRFLQAFVVPGRELNYEQEDHLRQVLAECARFGYLLFSQPAEYRFNYEGHGRRGGIVVCPGLERVADGEGRQFSKPQVLSAPVEDS